MLVECCLASVRTVSNDQEGSYIGLLVGHAGYSSPTNVQTSTFAIIKQSSRMM